MVLGFISLILTFTQDYIAKICISEDVADTMLPCTKGGEVNVDGSKTKHSRRLLAYAYEGRLLATTTSNSTCSTV